MMTKNHQALWDEFVQRIALEHASSKTDPSEVAARAAALADALVAERLKRDTKRSCCELCVDGVDITIPLDGWSKEQIEALSKVWTGYVSHINSVVEVPDPEHTQEAPSTILSSSPIDVSWDDSPEVGDEPPNNLIPFQTRTDEHE